MDYLRGFSKLVGSKVDRGDKTSLNVDFLSCFDFSYSSGLDEFFDHKVELYSQRFLDIPHPRLPSVITRARANVIFEHRNFVFFSDLQGENVWIGVQATAVFNAVWLDGEVILLNEEKVGVFDSCVRFHESYHPDLLSISEEVFSGFILHHPGPYHFFYDQYMWARYFKSSIPNVGVKDSLSFISLDAGGEEESGEEESGEEEKGVFVFPCLVGQWSPKERFAGREVLLLGTGPGVARHRSALERYIRDKKPLVLALNTQSAIDAELIDLRVACHPVRLLADCEAHTRLPQPLITPYSMLPADVRDSLGGKEVLDFGLNVEAESFAFEDEHCTLPTSLVVGYALAVATSGNASRILMAGFDGYSADDPRSREMHQLLEQYQAAEGALPITAITPTRYGLHSESVYAL